MTYHHQSPLKYHFNSHRVKTRDSEYCLAEAVPIHLKRANERSPFGHFYRVTESVECHLPTPLRCRKCFSTARPREIGPKVLKSE